MTASATEAGRRCGVHAGQMISRQYATPVGAIDGSEEQYYSDLLFFYDDPHMIYANWPKDVWAAIDAHQVKPGMNELETRLALGQKMQTDIRRRKATGPSPTTRMERSGR